MEEFKENGKGRERRTAEEKDWEREEKMEYARTKCQRDRYVISPLRGEHLP